MSMMKRLAMLVAQGKAVLAHGDYQLKCEECNVWFPISSIPRSVVEDVLSGHRAECYDCLMKGAGI